MNNAAIADREDGPASSVGIETLRRVFETNFLGTVALTQPLLPLLRAAECARIVNVSSGMGSLAINGDPSTPIYHMKLLAYSASKAALNMFTVDLAYDLCDTKIKVNSACPGYTSTDMNNHSGTQTIEEGAIAIVRLAQLPEDGPTGSFTHKDGTYPW